MQLQRLSLLGKLSVAILSGTLTTSCVTTSLPAKIDATRTACRSFEAIYWSKSDTKKTVAQVKEHNAVYVALCRGSKK